MPWAPRLARNSLADLPGTIAADLDEGTGHRTQDECPNAPAFQAHGAGSAASGPCFPTWSRHQPQPSRSRQTDQCKAGVVMMGLSECLVC